MQISADNPLGLRIPEQLPPKADTMVQPGDFEAWIKALPVGNSALMSKHLLHALQGINRVRIPPQRRVRIADLFIQPTVYAISSEERKFMDCSFPLSQKAHLSARLCVRLNEELAFAYKIAVHDVAMGKMGEQERKVLIVSLFCAVRHLAESVYRSVLIYDPVPQHTWRELHNLFAFAETNKWSATRVKIPGHGDADATTLRGQYVQVLLFAAAEPYHMRQPEIRALHLNLPRWISKVRLGAAVDLSPADTRFIIQLKKDQPAHHIGLLRVPPDRPALELNTEVLVQVLREFEQELPPQHAGVQAGLKSDVLSRGAIQHLIRSWGAPPQRRLERTQLHFDLKVAVGLSRIHGLISGDLAAEHSGSADFQTSAGEGQSEQSDYIQDLPDQDEGPSLIPMESEDGAFMHGSDSAGPGAGKGHAPPIWPREAGPRTQSSPIVALRTLNESAGGFCVNWRGPDIPGIKLGELVGIQAPDDPADYGLAVARWMRVDPLKGLELGLQLLAPHVFAVTVTEVERRRRTPARCLLVPELKSAHRPASLVAPLLPFEVGMSLYVMHAEREYRVRLVRLLESTGAFAQFQCEYE